MRVSLAFRTRLKPWVTISFASVESVGMRSSRTHNRTSSLPIDFFRRDANRTFKAIQMTTSTTLKLTYYEAKLVVKNLDAISHRFYPTLEVPYRYELIFLVPKCVNANLLAVNFSVSDRLWQKVVEMDRKRFDVRLRKYAFCQRDEKAASIGMLPPFRERSSSDLVLRRSEAFGFVHPRSETSNAHTHTYTQREKRTHARTHQKCRTCSHRWGKELTKTISAGGFAPIHEHVKLR
mmetsp:Transcript_18911/g.43878  ORF Transcript_18911/g.43878 Transcript_18911/m.43878 type:complete len:235 (-) Transcript_18911:126-830(-)